MKILLNLLPQEQKLTAARHVRFRMVVAQGSVLLLIVGLYCSMLFGISFLLDAELKSERESVQQNEMQSKNSGDIAAYESLFGDVNRQTSEISKILGAHISWEKFFRALDANVSADVAVTNILTKDYTLSISGTAKNRESLLRLEKQLGESDCFSDVRVPLSDLLEKENIDFQLDATIQESCLLSSKAS